MYQPILYQAAKRGCIIVSLDRASPFLARLLGDEAHGLAPVRRPRRCLERIVWGAKAKPPVFDHPSGGDGGAGRNYWPFFGWLSPEPRSSDPPAEALLSRANSVYL